METKTIFEFMARKKKQLNCHHSIIVYLYLEKPVDTISWPSFLADGNIQIAQHIL